MPKTHGDAGAQNSRHHHLNSRPRHNGCAHVQKIPNGKVQTHAKHQQHHADFCELLNHGFVHRRQPRNNAYCHACQNVAHQGGRPKETFGKITEGKRKAEAGYETRDKGIVLHGPSFFLSCARRVKIYAGPKLLRNTVGMQAKRIKQKNFTLWPPFGEALLTLSEQFFTLTRRIAPITSPSQKAKSSDDE